MWRLEPGDRWYAGYHEWLVHPDEAAVILARGYVALNGVRFAVRHMDTIDGHPVLRLVGLDEYGDPSDPQLPAADAVTRSRMCLAA